MLRRNIHSLFPSLVDWLSYSLIQLFLVVLVLILPKNDQLDQTEFHNDFPIHSVLE